MKINDEKRGDMFCLGEFHIASSSECSSKLDSGFLFFIFLQSIDDG